MNNTQTHPNPHKAMWRKAYIRLIPTAILSIAGAIVCSRYGDVRSGTSTDKFIALIGVIIFVIFAGEFVRVLTKTIYKLINLSHLNLSTGRAAAIQFILRVIGYVAIFLMTLSLVGIPIGKLLLGGVALGIILSVAAQQALANFFASIVLIISHPFSVGDNITINSGPLGGKYIGEVKDIGLTHTQLEIEHGNKVLLPNASLLSAASITLEKPTTEPLG